MTNSIPRVSVAFVFTIICCLSIFPGTFFLFRQNVSKAFAGVSPPRVPYAKDSPWNMKIGLKPVYDRHSAMIVEGFEGVFGSDPARYTMPVYEVDHHTPKIEVAVSGFFSNVTQNGKKLAIEKATKVMVPVPPNAAQAKGSDGQMILWNLDSGDEWGFWRMKKAAGSWTAVNGYHYNTEWSGVPPTGFVSRGAGLPYLAGLIRPWEIRQKKIDHAIAFGVNYPNPLFIYPATKSDGTSLEHYLPAGARLQLDPLLTENDFRQWGLDRPGIIIAKALQEYGMILVDGSGHPKLYAEYEGTASWNGLVTKHTVKKIPLTAFKVLSFKSPEKPGMPAQIKLNKQKKGIMISWGPVPFATRYRISRQEKGKPPVLLSAWVEKTIYLDTGIKSALNCYYTISGVNHNGVGKAGLSPSIDF